MSEFPALTLLDCLRVRMFKSADNPLDCLRVCIHSIRFFTCADTLYDCFRVRTLHKIVLEYLGRKTFKESGHSIRLFKSADTP